MSTSDGSTVNGVSAPWQAKSARKQAERETKLAAHPDWRLQPKHIANAGNHVSSLLTSHISDRERQIVQHDATGLLKRIHSGGYTSEEVLVAYIKVALAAQDLLNCLTEVFFDEGLERARQLDRHYAATGNIVGPFHGLPVSIKDHVLVKGHDTASGYSAWAENTIATKDAVVVDILRQLGAVLYVKTANPQTLLSLETDNNIYGHTSNPFNRTLSPGGSSGGESALVASHGSPIGIGTDIGGSIRVPAAHCGLYGIKASVARMPHAGLMGSHDGMDNIVGVVGPIARSARDLGLFMRVILDTEPWLKEHAIIQIPWKPDVYAGLHLPKKLCIAILADDGVVRPHPPLLDALDNYKKALVVAGHEVIEWKPFNHQEAWDLIVKLYFLDGGEEYRETLAESGEPAIPTFEWIVGFAEGRKPYTVRETFKLNGIREQFKAAALAHWNAMKTSTGRPVDAVLTPTFATLAPPHNTTRWWGYSSYWNLLDLPGVVFPTGRRLAATDYPDTPADSLPAPRNDAEKYIRSQWNPKTYEGAPVSLQLVGRRHCEEQLLAILDVVEAAAKALDSE